MKRELGEKQPNHSRNPCHLCTWQPISACEGCPIAGQLKCRFTWEDLLHFGGLFWAFALPAWIGMIMSGYG